MLACVFQLQGVATRPMSRVAAFPASPAGVPILTGRLPLAALSPCRRVAAVPRHPLPVAVSTLPPFPAA